jgi:2-aminoadipate transaminase
MKRSFIRQILEAIDENTISFAGGLPDENLFPTADLALSTKKILSKSNIWQYSKTNGLDTLREKIASRYTKEGFETKAENILITTGSQQALFILARYFKDQKIILEQPSYLGAINTFKLNGLKIKSIKLEDDGIDIKRYKKLSEKVKLSYLIPDFQNPSTATYSKAKREAVAKIIKKNKAYLIEDSPYSDLYFEKKFKTISSSIPDRSFLLGSFSKTLAPSLRIGWIRADVKLIEKLLPIKESIDLHSCGLAQGVLDEYLKDTKSFEKHLKTLQSNYKQKMEYFCECLDKKLPEFKYTKPKGGMFVYGKFEGVDIYKLLDRCMEKKVVFVPADEFYVGQKGSCEVRFNFTNSTFSQIEKGIDIIASIKREN